MIEGSEIDGESLEAPVTYPPKPSMNKLNDFPGMQGWNPNFKDKFCYFTKKTQEHLLGKTARETPGRKVEHFQWVALKGPANLKIGCLG